MTSENHNKKDTSLVKGNMIGIILLTFLFGGVVLGILAMNTRNALNMTEHHGQMIHTVMEIQYESTLFHLGLEELLLANTTLKKEQVWQHFTTAKVYAHAVLSGGETPEGRIRQTNHPELRKYIKQSLMMLEQLNTVAKKRYDNKINDADLKSLFEVIYEGLQEHAEMIEVSLRKIINQQKKDYTLFAFIMGVIILLGTVLTAYLFYRYENLRIKDTLQLKDNETRKRVILENMIDGVITLDDNGIITSVNPSVESMFLYQADELIGRNISLIAAKAYTYMNESYIHNHHDEDSNVISIGRMFDAQRKDGSVFPLEVSISQVKLEQQRMYTAIVRDISKRKEAEAELEKHRKHLEVLVEERTNEMKASRDEAEKASYAKSEFLSHMSHELRTPLNAILGFAQMLGLDAESFNENQKDNVNEILNAGHHLLDLINEVLDLTKIESGKMDISKEDVCLADVLQQCLPLITPMAAARDISIIDNISNLNYYVIADNIRLVQALVNLLSNAVKYNRNNGHIILDCEITNNQRLRISVVDRGEGISADELKKLFIPFERLDKLSHIEGAGIGLVITKHIIELMDGTIGAESTVGEGTKFWIELVLSNQAVKGKVNG